MDDIYQLIESNDIEGLISLVEGRPCACRGRQGDDLYCPCVMKSNRVRETVSYFGLKQGKIYHLRTKQE